MRLSLTLTLVILFSLCPLAGSRAAEDYRTQFQTARDAHEDGKAQAVLDGWKSARPDDPEYYISAANYLLNKAGGVVVSRQGAAPGGFVITDPKTGQAVGSLSAGAPSAPTYQAAVDLLKQALTKSPQRLDIHLGLATLYRRMDDPKAVVSTLAALAAYAKAHPEQLQWKEGAPYPSPINHHLALAINDFARDYFDSDTPASNQALHDLAQLDADSYPDEVYGHNLLGVYYTAVDKQPKLALASYARALKLVPDDSYVWMNVGLLQARQKDNKKAAEAFRKIVELNNDPSCVEQAKSELAKLK